jgi:hypothetical protein
MGDVLRNGEGNRKIWRDISTRYVDIERQNMEVSMKEKRSVGFYNELKSS